MVGDIWLRVWVLGSGFRVSGLGWAVKEGRLLPPLPDTSGAGQDDDGGLGI